MNIMRTDKDISVILCTYNRSASLSKTLEHMKKMDISVDIRWELLVVDNNSKDDTKDVVELFCNTSGINCTYILETKQGLSFARNNGIGHATGDIIVFTDDDVLVDKNWIKNIYKAFKEHAEAACIGGKILPQWEKPCPNWLNGQLLSYIALCDHGNETMRLSEPRVWGANLAIRSSMFRKYGLFETHLGHTGAKLYGGEETHYLDRMLGSGECILYCPEILVHHCIPESRMRKAYFRKWKADKGELYALQLGEYKDRNILGIPLIFFRKTLRYLLYCVADVFKNSEVSINNQLDLFYNIGVIRGRLKFYNDKRISNH